MRIERAAADSGIDLARAAKRQKREDQIRSDMSIQLYGWDPRDPTRYIFHVGHTCSTLLSRALGELRGCLALREPMALLEVAAWRRAGRAPAAALSCRP